MKIARTIIFTLLILGVAAFLILKHQSTGNSLAAKSLADAAKQGKPAWLFIHSTSDPSCSECEKTFADLQTEFTGKIIFIDVDFNNPAEKGLMKEYGVTTVPTSIFFDGHGKAVDKKVGQKPPDEYKDTLQQLLEIT